MTDRSRRLTGVIPPVVTPLTRERRFDRASFERVVARHLDAGVDGIFVLGSTGEVAFATDDMRREVIAAAVEVVAGRVPVVAGVVDMQTANVVRHVEVAAELGADAVVATAPFYAITHEPQIRRHFELVAASSSLPVLAYDLPQCVHVKLSPRLLVELGSAGVIAGVKDSSGDDISFGRLVQLNREAGSPLSVLTGHELVIAGAYLAGADGSVPGIANVDPVTCVALQDACRRGDWAAAAQLQERLIILTGIYDAARGTSGWGAGVGAMKAALVELGVIADAQLPEPFEAFDGADMAAVAAVLEAAGLQSTQRSTQPA